MSKIIRCNHILPSDLFTDDFPIKIDLVYANPDDPENSSEKSIILKQDYLGTLIC